MVVAAVVVGAAAVVGAGATAYAGNEAKVATEDASNASIAEQKSALSQQEQLEAPYNKIGTDATSQYEALLGVGPNANAQTIGAALKNTPGYQFTQQQGEQGILNAGSAAGGLSGNTLTALDQYNTGLADQTYQTALNNSMGAVQLGQAAASGTAANIGSAASNISNTETSQGANIASIDVNEAAGISKALGSGANQLGSAQEAQTLKALST
jgi:hypothetical protein